MSEPEITIEEELSADLFSSDIELSQNTSNAVNSDSSSMSVGVNEPEPDDNDVPTWKGMSMDEIRRGLGVYECQEHPPIIVSPCHTVLFMLPLRMQNGPPKPYPTHQVDKWSQGYVRMPHSTHSLYPIEQRSGSRSCRNRWEMIQEALLRNILSSQQLEEAILSYNQIYAQRWNFAGLHHFFSEILDSEETTMFFETLMPKIVQLALQLPVLLTGAIPLLKRHTNASISLSQLQVASLLANAFFCTFPRRNSSNPQSEYATYPYINFNKLFGAYNEKHSQSESLMEKIKCLFHYFRRVTTKAPEGIITIERRYIPLENCPRWNLQDQKLSPLHITSKGTIESEGAGLLQVDFANKYVGGGVLGLGCVQEEIRFVICPELMVTMLVTEELDDTEALIVSGIERYSKYEGYSNTFKWKGDFVDETPRDNSGRRMTSIVAIDALYFRQSSLQFNVDNINRELNKAYVGFVGSDVYKNNLPAIATGNWGCGAFRGNPKLKVLIQLMAAAVAGRSMVYFTFGDTKLRDDVAAMYAHLVHHDIDIARLYSMLSEYRQESASKAHSDFYCFLYNRSRIKPLSKYFSMKTECISTNISVECLKEITSFKKNQTASLSNKDVDNKRYLYSAAKEKEMAEEEKIMNWLTSCEDDSNDNAKLDTQDTCEKTKSDPKETDNHKNDGLEDNHSINNTVDGKNIRMEDQMSNKFEAVKSSNSKESIAPCLVDNQDTSKKIKTELSSKSAELNDSESVKVSKDCTPESCKQKSLPKKSGQKKISDFFQRIS
ncbi:poly(ADP-ribose) glycohydrolase [Monomorium pharaonis]|uniref:poly(ADP-ribose) glycohydrolase n=1 Tax=Monomorium pharaonis TaxID=307658 RepID=UPI00063EE60F|nr:poly(ADP-ribose) glycohydrolase [Monomorium pharaonis]